MNRNRTEYDPWDEVEQVLQQAWQRGPLTLEQAQIAFKEAPDHVLSDEEIDAVMDLASTRRRRADGPNRAFYGRRSLGIEPLDRRDLLTAAPLLEACCVDLTPETTPLELANRMLSSCIVEASGQSMVELGPLQAGSAIGSMCRGVDASSAADETFGQWPDARQESPTCTPLAVVVIVALAACRMRRRMAHAACFNAL